MNSKIFREQVLQLVAIDPTGGIWAAITHLQARLGLEDETVRSLVSGALKKELEHELRGLRLVRE